MIDRYLLRYFLAVLDFGNFSRAAIACNVSQPTLSAGIAKLEKSLGRVLFNRTNRRVELTEAGLRLVKRARSIEAEFSHAEREVRDIETTQTIRLGMLSTIPGIWFDELMKGLRVSGSKERVQFSQGRERDLLDGLARGRIDIALNIIRPGQSRLNAEPLLSEEYSVAVADHHPLAGRSEVDAEEMSDSPMIVRRQCEALADTSKHFTSRGIRPFFSARTTSDDHAMTLIAAGVGITVMPASFQAEGISRPSLSGFGLRREIGLQYGPHGAGSAVRDSNVVNALRDAAAVIRATTERM